MKSLEEGLASGSSLLLLLATPLVLLGNFLAAQDLRVGVEAEENGLVEKRVLFLGPGALLDLLASGADDGLDLVAVDEASDIRVGDLGSRKIVVLLVRGGLVERTEDLIEQAEGTLGPDDKAT